MEGFVRWIEIDLEAIVYNFFQIKKIIPKNTQIMSVVKANAYGHGGVKVAHALAEAGSDMFGVTTMEEGMELVASGIKQPILVFTPLLPDQAAKILDTPLISTIDSKEAFMALARESEKRGVKGQYHLKIESGMGRIGITIKDLPPLLAEIKQHPQMMPEGIYSHFATAMEQNSSYTKTQLITFLNSIDIIKKEKIDVGLKHIANSGATLNLGESHLDMVRVGTLLYGQYPSAQGKKILDLRDPWQMKSRIVTVKKLSPGQSVGYGRDYLVKKPMKIGVVPVGYADGFGVVPQTRPAKFRDLVKSTAKTLAELMGIKAAHCVWWGDKALPVVGRIGMQLSMVDLKGQEILPGTEVKIPVRRTTTGAGIPRIYFR